MLCKHCGQPMPEVPIPNAPPPIPEMPIQKSGNMIDNPHKGKIQLIIGNLGLIIAGVMLFAEFANSGPGDPDITPATVVGGVSAVVAFIGRFRRWYHWA